MDIFGVLQLVGGLCLFLFGMETMGDGLTRASGSKLESILESLTSNVFRGVILGAVVTAVIQSSSATTVMLVGFVNSGIMKLRQVIPVIMGANIGTTATAWLLSLTGLEGDNVFIQLLKPMSFSPVLAAIGIVFIMFLKSEKKANIGYVMVGFATLMYGMDIMSSAVEPLKDVPEFVSILTMFENPILGVAAGAIVTAAIQSSSASVGILQALCLTGSMSYATVIPIIMGQNIGTCVTAVLSSIGANKNAKRVAAVHLSFNLIGTFLFLFAFYGINAVVGFSFMHDAVGPENIALVHSIFNITVTLVLLPFYKQLEQLATVIVKDSPEPEKKPQDGTLTILDERFMETPAVAVAQVRTAAHKMAELSRTSIVEAINLLNNWEDDKFDYVRLLESKIDRYEDAIGAYIVKLSRLDMSNADSKELSMILHNIGDLERISDHAKNIAETAQELHVKGIEFSADALAELKVYTDAVNEVVDLAIESFINADIETAMNVEPLEEVIDVIHTAVKTRHVKRLQAGKCTIELGFVLTDLGTNLERVADHCSNLAVCTIETQRDEFDMHHYIKSVKKYDIDRFTERVHNYEAKYTLPL